ncbi:hypothetical protein GCM10009751_05620 [Myceligenerans crystallogenes]|uniref:Secreted protein n=1 Tax=Myceligenerans crystallogenes TaxID=316335 RepID=A0ABN2N5C0_9MICO
MRSAPLVELLVELLAALLLELSAGLRLGPARGLGVLWHDLVLGSRFGVLLLGLVMPAVRRRRRGLRRRRPVRRLLVGPVERGLPPGRLLRGLVRLGGELPGIVPHVLRGGRRPGLRGPGPGLLLADPSRERVRPGPGLLRSGNPGDGRRRGLLVGRAGPAAPRAVVRQRAVVR